MMPDSVSPVGRRRTTIWPSSFLRRRPRVLQIELARERCYHGDCDLRLVLIRQAASAPRTAGGALFAASSAFSRSYRSHGPGGEDLLRLADDGLAEAGDFLQFAPRGDVGGRLGQVFQGADGIAVGAYLERVLALPFQNVRDLLKNIGDFGIGGCVVHEDYLPI